MAKNSIRDYSATNSLNTDIQSIDISEGCSPAGINNAIREVMADLKDVSTGAVALESPSADSLTVTGDITVDTNTLYVDSTNNRVGIGTSSPDQTLVVKTADGGGIAIENAAGNQYRWAVNGDDSFSVVDSGTAERLRINSSGNVGIGTSSPTGKLDVEDNTGSLSGTNDVTAEFFRNDGTYGPRLQIRHSTVGSDIHHTYGSTASNLTFSVANTEAMRIDSNGNVRVNTTSSLGSAKFFVESDTTSVNPISVINTRASAATDYHMLFYRAGNLVGSIQTSLSATSYVTSSDYRLKTSVNYDWDATTRLKQLRPARFEWIADGDDAVPVDGFLAHEVQDIVPEAVTGTKDAMRDEEYEVTPAVLDEDGNVVTPAVMGTRSVPDYQGIDQSKLVPLLVKTIQELEARITALEAN